MPERNIEEENLARFEVIMSIASEILRLRREQSSSVEMLIGAIAWEKSAQRADHRRARHCAVVQLADVVLTNVAVHAAEALGEPPTTRGTRRDSLPSRRKRRSFDAGRLSNRMWGRLSG